LIGIRDFSYARGIFHNGYDTEAAKLFGQFYLEYNSAKTILVLDFMKQDNTLDYKIEYIIEDPKNVLKYEYKSKDSTTWINQKYAKPDESNDLGIQLSDSLHFEFSDQKTFFKDTIFRYDFENNETSWD